MGVDTDPFPQVAATNMTTPNFSKLSRPRIKVDLSKIEDQRP